MEEIWEDVADYEGLYQVSNFGNVKSKARQGAKGGMLKYCKDGRGYLTIGLHKNNINKTFRVHILVAMSFKGHKPSGSTKGLVIDHIDNNKLNNHADNLKIITQRENSSKDRKGYTSEFIGVSWDKSSNKWVAKIQFNGRLIHLGYFKHEIDAHNAYQNALKLINEGVDLNILYPKKVKTSQYKGIYWDKYVNKWRARYKGKYLGIFDTELEAHEAREKHIKSLV